MSCIDDICGTGLGGINIPKPGDPDNNVSLSATSVYGGINVSWSYPTINPHAVAHTILYRGTTNDFSKAIELAHVGGNVYYDQLSPEGDTVYYYWIRFRTVNGTLLDAVGPVSATAKPRGMQTLESLTGLIDQGVLAQSLKTSIAGINLQGAQLLKEIQDRIGANTELAGLIAAVQSGQQDAMTYVQQEITQRAVADSAIVTMVNNMAAAVANNAAAILTESQVRADKDSATAAQVTTLFSQTASNLSAIQDEATTRTNAVSAMATSISTLTTRVGTAESTLRDEQTIRASADAALSTRVTSAESTLFGNVVTGQIALTTQINSQNGKITSLGALYTAKLQVNGLIGGFGVYNDGNLVDAGFDVDRFWVGRTGPDKVKPFIIDNGIVYMDKARIRTADIDTLKLAGNAVTIPTFISGYGGATYVTPGSRKNIANFTVNYPYDVDVAFQVNWQTADVRTHAGNTTMTIEANGQQVLFWDDSVPNGMMSSHAAGSKTRLSAGTYTFSVYVGNNWTFGDWDLSRWSVLLMGVMR